MPNLSLSQSLRQKYAQGKLAFSNEAINYINENLQLTSQEITKGFNFNFRPQAHFNPTRKTEADIEKKTKILEYLEGEKESDAVLLFIDISGFSKKVSGWDKKTLSDYLDNYYDIVAPIIYKYGGEIEKVMGDGIICFFGEPYIDRIDTEKEDVFKKRLFQKANDCSQEIITVLYRSDKAVKVALCDGKIKFYKMKLKEYQEYTMIGQPLTDLYRLESVSEDNAINFYERKFLDSISFKYREKIKVYDTEWGILLNQPVDLKGISFDTRSYIKLIKREFAR